MLNKKREDFPIRCLTDMEHTFQTFLYPILDNRNQPRNENGMEYSIFKDRIPYKIENGPVVLKYRHMDHS